MLKSVVMALMVCGWTAVLGAAESAPVENLLPEPVIRGFGGCAVEMKDGVTLVKVNAETKPFAGIYVRTARGPVDWRHLPSGTVAKFEVNGGETPSGERCGKQRIQVKIDKTVAVPVLDDDPATFELVEVPVADLLDSANPKSNHLMIQFRGTGAQSGVEIRNFVLEKR